MTMTMISQLEAIQQISITQKIHRMMVVMGIGIRIVIKSLLGMAENFHGIIIIRQREITIIIIIRQQAGIVEKLGTIILLLHPLGIPLNLHGRLTLHKLSNLL